MILLIDNYDSFTFNIVQYMGELGCFPKVIRNRDMGIEEMAKLPVEKLIVSPGPCSPKEAGVSCDAIRHFSNKGVPVFGVCLGHQCIGEVFGGKIVHAPTLMHGKVSDIYHDATGVLKGLPSPFKATRYHSLVIEPETCPACLAVNAKTNDDVIMGVRHKTLKVYGVQFHPESILTEHGRQIIRNFLDL